MDWVDGILDGISKTFDFVSGVNDGNDLHVS